MTISEDISKIIDRLRRGDRDSARTAIAPILDVVEKGSGAYKILSRVCGEELLGGMKFHPQSIYLVTPSFNSAATIGRTIDSVTSQAGDFFLHYHIQDGGSTDGTLQLLENYKHRIENKIPSRVRFTYSSCRDNGMYDALHRGFDSFQMSPNSWMGWINSDDQLADGALKLLAALSPSEEIEWVTGQPSIRLLDGVLRNHNIFYSNELLASGLCDGKSWWFLQQEGTFWRSKWWADLSKYSHFCHNKFAGDYHLWRELADYTELYQYDGPMGHFNKREGQISSAQIDKYHLEIALYWNRYLNRPRLKKYSEHTLKRISLIKEKVEINQVKFRVDGKFCVKAL